MTTTFEQKTTRTDTATEHVPVVIVGSGFSGLGMAIRLRETGFTDFAILERGDDVGGTWRDNDYPGAACDVPSRLYSFSFAPNPNWSRSFSPQSEILDYLRDCADRFGVRPHVRLNCEVLDATWDEERRRWRLRTEQGDLTSDVLVSASGGLSDPKLPAIPGADRFAGTVFHSASWNHDHDLTGERVAVIGTGASAIQIVPEIQPKVAQVDVYQRTPAWIVPRTDRDFSALERRLYRFRPIERLARAAIYWGRELYVLGFTKHRKLMDVPHKIALTHLHKQVRDPELREKLTPEYTIGCKRILISNEFYPALDQPNADVVTSPIQEIREHSIVTRDGTEREVDTIVFATGFQATPPPIAERVRGTGGRRLIDEWRENGMQGYRGTTVAGFPNLFFLVGPNTGLGHTSMVHVIESQIQYVRSALETMRERGIASVEPRREAQARWNERLQQRLDGTVWNTGGCASWYLDDAGRNTTLWPGFTFELRARLRQFDVANYVTTSRTTLPVAPRESMSLSASGA